MWGQMYSKYTPSKVLREALFAHELAKGKSHLAAHVTADEELKKCDAGDEKLRESIAEAINESKIENAKMQ